ncbi:rCG40846 [Rattus norvegicus]|uniref:RCG40846 n=1 Tax=Rattus norvegicus TaxID=10116 RepID=A6KL39_RAT|nr:rCG40846 [Rattus norvegicus]
MWFYSETCRVRWTNCLAWVSGVTSHLCATRCSPHLCLPTEQFAI